MTNPYEKVYELSSKQKKKIIEDFRIDYQGAEFSVRTIGSMSHGCFISLSNNGNHYRVYWADLTKGNNGNKVSVKIRSEGDFSNRLERALEDFLLS